MQEVWLQQGEPGQPGASGEDSWDRPPSGHSQCADAIIAKEVTKSHPSKEAPHIFFLRGEDKGEEMENTLYFW